MGTSSNIGILNSNGTVDFTYCSYDGVPECVRNKLYYHYNNEPVLRDLFKYGIIIDLQDTIQVSEFSHRDYGGDLETFPPVSLNDFHPDRLFDPGIDSDYYYLFKDNKWNIFDLDKDEWIELTSELCSNAEN